MLNAWEIERTERWPFCAGLPLVEDRLMRPEERTEIGRLARSLTSLGIGCFIGSPIVGTALAIALYVFLAHIHAPANSGLYTAAWIGAALLVFMCAVLFAYDGPFQRGRRLFKDLRGGYVREFAGVLEADQVTDPKLIKLRSERYENAEGDIDAEGSREISFSILPVSHRIWRLDGHICRRWVDASWIEVSMPSGSVTTGSAVGLGNHHRSLSVSERQELTLHTRRLWQGPLIGVLITGCLFIVSVTSLAAKTTSVSLFLWTSAICYGLFSLTLGRLLIQRLREARILKRDLRQGEVEVHQAGGEPTAVFEVLPASGWQWTQGGQPAPWRRFWQTESWKATYNDRVTRKTYDDT